MAYPRGVRVWTATSDAPAGKELGHEAERHVVLDPAVSGYGCANAIRGPIGYV